MRMTSVRLIMSIVVVFAPLSAGAFGAELSAVHIVGLDYPRLAHMAGVQGDVELVLTIGRDGAVSAVTTKSGNGLLVGPTADTLKKWTFSPCADTAGECRYSMSIHFLLRGGPLDISQCRTTFQFDVPGVAVVESQLAKAIVN
jgi:hypothetical protein